MTSIQPLTVSQESSGGGLVTMGLGFLVLMYFMYDHFEKRLRLQAELNEGTEARFRVTEDRLATLNEIEEDVRALTEAEEERKSSWEDDVTEPGKYQAILGTGVHDFRGIKGSLEIRFIRCKLNTFKSNRYWLLNNEINFDVLKLFWEKYITKPQGWSERDGKLYWSVNILTGIDELSKIEICMEKIWNLHELNFIHDYIGSFEPSLKDSTPNFKWKRALVDV